jgi:hypothetical protein
MPSFDGKPKALLFSGIAVPAFLAQATQVASQEVQASLNLPQQAVFKPNPIVAPAASPISAIASPPKENRQLRTRVFKPLTLISLTGGLTTKAHKAVRKAKLQVGSMSALILGLSILVIAMLILGLDLKFGILGFILLGAAGVIVILWFLNVL